jgi:lambda family phage tail tape measure protein
MANNQTITATLQLQDPGKTVDKGTRSLERLNAENEKLQRSTKRQSVAAAMSEKADYNASRAIGQGTGASSRDFAKEAQGLGGLVRLYATLAANLFAAEAAFRALSNAMNTENMISGLDQMSASSGQALGALSKRFSETTGFAISLRDSVEAVSKASSAGLNQQQILQVADVAKKASQSLGISMSDAVSRLTRGISKLEPELLDELGLFTKLGKATEDYAAKIGKPVSALTDFERRQAFANAVLKEGADKFGSINIPTNPYDKLLASLANIAQTGLTLVNVVLKPIVDLLASSPMALTAVITALGLAIFKKFIPAVGELRASMRDEANKLADMAGIRAAEAKKAFNQTQELRKKALGQEYNDIEQVSAAKIAAADATLKKVAKSGMSKEARKITDPTREISSISEKELAYIDELGKKQTKVSGQYRAWAEAVRDAHRIAQEEAVKTAKYNDLINKPASTFTTAGIAQIRAESARKAAAGKNVVINASEVAATESLWSGVKKLSEGIKTEKLGVFRGALTGIAGAANIAAVAIGNIGTFLSKFLGPIGAIISAWQMLDLVFGTASKEMEELKSKGEQLSEVIKTATEVTKKYDMTLTVASIGAKATALGNLVDTLDTIAPALDNALAKMGVWTKFWDKVLPEFLGGGVAAKLSGQFTEGIVKGLDLAITPEAREEAAKKLSSLLNIDPNKMTPKGLEEALAKAGAGTREKAKAIIDQLKKDANSLNTPLQRAKEGFASLDKAYLELNNSFINNDVGSKFAVELIGQVNNLNEVLSNPITRVAQLVAISKDLSLVKMFPPDAQRSLVEAAQNIDSITKSINESKKAMEMGQGKIDAAKNLEQGGMPQEVYIRIQMEGEAQLAAATEVHKESTKKLEQINGNLKAGMTSAMSASIGILEAPLTRALAQANIASQKAVVSMFPRSEAAVALTAKLELQSIEIRKQEITALYNLTKSFDLYRLGEERKALVQERMANGTVDAKESERVDKRIKSVDDQINALTAKDYKTAFGKNGEGVDQATAAIIARRVGFDTKLAELAGQGKMVEINKARDMVAARYDKIGEQLNSEFASVKASNEQYVKSTEFAKKSDSEKAKEIESIRQIEQQYQNSIAALPGLKDIATFQAGADMAGAGGKGKNAAEIATLAKQEIAYSQQKLDSLNKQQTSIESAAQAEANRKIASTDYVEATKSINLELDRQVGIQLQALTQNQSDLDYAKNKLEFEQQFGKYTLDEYAQRQLSLELSSAEVERAKGKLDLQQSFNKSIQDLVATQIAAGNVDSQKSLEERQNLINNNNIAMSNLDQQYAGRVRLAQLEKDRQDYNAKREQDYAKAFERGIDNMTDSFINFAKTGKFSFKDLANAVIQDIARIEIRMRLMQVAANEGGFLNMAKSFLGFAPANSLRTGDINSSITATTSVDALNLPGLTLAKGGAFDVGLRQFAKGGAFTNSIVNSPTMFKFAQGAGLMGEAGPEAIMPLKRDSQGNLGVRANQQQNVEVVVNNYGSEKATTKESVNNRGERKIEVVIGDAIAGEISRPGSAVQQSLSSNFGNRPAVARR